MPKSNSPSDTRCTPSFVGAEVIAKKYDVSTRYVLLMAQQGRIPSIRIGKKCVRFSEAAVAAALEGTPPQ